MLVIPALDLKDNAVVRLLQGNMEQATIYSDNPLRVVDDWVSQGAKRLHLVDLNGAFAGEPIHFNCVAQIAKKHPKIAIEVGGGIRDLETVKKYIDHGVKYVILGTVAVKNPKMVDEICTAIPGQVILGIDAKNGLVATHGWSEHSKLKAFDLLNSFKDHPIESVIYTDISKDGMLESMNFLEIKKMAEIGIPVIASGGLSELDDIDQLKAIDGVSGVIAGKAIYESRFTVAEAISRAN